MSFTTLMVASPAPMVREGVRALLQTTAELYWLSDAVNRDDLLAYVRDLRVDVVVLDLDLFDGPVESVLEQLQQLSPNTKFIALVENWQDMRIIGALRQGVHGFIERRSSGDEIAQAIRVVQGGQLALNPAITSRLMQPMLEPALEPLSPRELEVLQALARGLPNKLIAQELIISEHTVKFHIRSILDKLSAANRTDAVRIGIERGLIAI